MLSAGAGVWAVSTPAGCGYHQRSTATSPGSVEVVVSERAAWDKRPGELLRAYEAFRTYRDAGQFRTLQVVADRTGVSVKTMRRWSAQHDWVARASAWDDEVYMLEDRRRLEAIRTMHDTHQRAARAAIGKALAALNAVDPGDIAPGAAVRLLELGTRLERDTLTVSVADLQGVAGVSVADPWDAIAREFQDAAADASP
jgi:hypothetical protein